MIPDRQAEERNPTWIDVEGEPPQAKLCRLYAKAHVDGVVRRADPTALAHHFGELDTSAAPQPSVEADAPRRQGLVRQDGGGALIQYGEDGIIGGSAIPVANHAQQFARKPIGRKVRIAI